MGIKRLRVSVIIVLLALAVVVVVAGAVGIYHYYPHDSGSHSWNTLGRTDSSRRHFERCWNLYANGERKSGARAAIFEAVISTADECQRDGEAFTETELIRLLGPPDFVHPLSTQSRQLEYIYDKVARRDASAMLLIIDGRLMQVSSGAAQPTGQLLVANEGASSTRPALVPRE